MERVKQKSPNPEHFGIRASTYYLLPTFKSLSPPFSFSTARCAR